MYSIICVMSIGSFITGIGTIQLILFILGLILLFAEIFLPGFGIAGGCGFVLLVAAIIMTARTPLEAFLMLLILLLLAAVVLLIILRSVKKGKLSKKLILRAASKREEGYSTSDDYKTFIGKEGVALSLLRPSGIGEFDSQRLDVISQGAYIEPGTKIRIIQAEGRRIVVKPIR